MTAIIDYDAGNLRSVEKAFAMIGEKTCITRDRDVLLAADRVVLPGVGNFGDAMGKLENYGLIPVIHEVVDAGIPFLGICLGLQLMFEESEESPDVKGLGIFKGKILRIPDGEGLKIPHIGWNDLTWKKGSKLFDGLEDHPYVYFVHSYYLKAEDPEIVAGRTTYGVSIDAAVERDKVFACQFHPEKSSSVGLSILKNFVAVGR